MDKAEREKLQGIIKQGKANYVLTYGSRYALVLFVGFWFFYTFIFQEEFYYPVWLITCLIGGLVFGLWGWSSINKNVKETTKVLKETKESGEKIRKEKEDLKHDLRIIIATIIILIIIVLVLLF